MFAIRRSVGKSGCEEFVDLLETVIGSRPSCSASYLPVFPSSARTAFIRFIFSILNILMSNAKLIKFLHMTKGL